MLLLERDVADRHVEARALAERSAVEARGGERAAGGDDREVVLRRP